MGAIALGAALAGLSPALAATDGPLAPERYNRFVLGGESGMFPLDAVGAASSDHGVFRIWTSGGDTVVHSTENVTAEGLQAISWPETPVMYLTPGRSAFAASPSEDYLALATISSESASGPPQVRVQVMNAGWPTVALDHYLSLPSTGDLASPRSRVAIAASGSDIYLVGVSGSASTGTQQVVVLHSADRGSHWSAPTDLQSVTGLGSTPGIPDVKIEASGSHLAVYLVEGAEQRVLRSDDAGSTWTNLGDPAPAGTRSTLGLGWLDDTLRAAWAATDADITQAYTTVSTPGSGWSTPEALPDHLGASVLTRTPVVHQMGSTWVIGGVDDLHTLWSGQWLPVYRTPTPGQLFTIGSDRAIYQTIAPAYMFVADNAAPVVSASPSPRAFESPSFITSLSADDTGLLSNVECWFDGVPVTAYTEGSPASCAANEGPLADGTHTARMRVVDDADHVTDKSVSWTVDGTGPTLRLTAAPPRWAHAGHRVRWSWTATDALSGIRFSTVGHVEGNSRFGVRLRTWKAQPGRRSVLLPGDTTACLSVTAEDRTGNFASTDQRCSTALTDDGQLIAEGPRRSVRGSAYAGGSATQLVGPRSKLRQLVTNRAVTGLALRVLTCPSCGKVRVHAGSRTIVVDLHSAQPGVRTIELPYGEGFDKTTKHIFGIVVERSGSGQVVIDGIFVETKPW